MINDMDITLLTCVMSMYLLILFKIHIKIRRQVIINKFIHKIQSGVYYSLVFIDHTRRVEVSF